MTEHADRIMQAARNLADAQGSHEVVVERDGDPRIATATADAWVTAKNTLADVIDVELTAALDAAYAAPRACSECGTTTATTYVVTTLDPADAVTTTTETCRACDDALRLPELMRQAAIDRLRPRLAARAAVRAEWKAAEEAAHAEVAARVANLRAGGTLADDIAAEHYAPVTADDGGPMPTPSELTRERIDAEVVAERAEILARAVDGVAAAWESGDLAGSVNVARCAAEELRDALPDTDDSQ